MVTRIKVYSSRAQNNCARDFLIFKEEKIMKYEILKLLARNAKYTAEEIAVMLGTEEATVNSENKAA